jgi:phenylacetaldehyde dehydrogenase
VSDEVIAIERTIDQSASSSPDRATRIGPLVSDEQFQRVTGFLESGRQQGAEVVTGGKRFGKKRILSRTDHPDQDDGGNEGL